jgi:hypothetical protein
MLKANTDHSGKASHSCNMTLQCDCRLLLILEITVGTKINFYRTIYDYLYLNI